MTKEDNAASKKIEGTEGTEGTALIANDFPGTLSERAEGTELNKIEFSCSLTPVMPAQAPPDQIQEPEITRPSFQTHDDWFLIDGAKKRPGLYWHGYSESKGEKEPSPIDVWVCLPIHAEAVTYGEGGGSFGLLLRFMDALGKWHLWAAPMYMLKGSGEELRGELLDLGLRMNLQKRNYLSQWVMERYPSRKILAATRTGWHSNASAFVMPNRTLGSDDFVYQSEHAIHEAYQQRGSLHQWRDNVARPCRGNPVLILALCSAFAGPLLLTARQQHAGGAGIHLVGDSSQGKTTALEVAASVWGGPDFRRTWRATANGLEATAASQNDSALILDEISECDPREIGRIVYALANGVGKQRAARTGGARQSAQWRIMLLSSGEKTLAGHMSEGGRQVKAGQEARLLDVPATGREYGVFDSLHDFGDGRTLADTLKQNASKFYGHAGPAFIEALLNRQSDLPAEYALFANNPRFKGRDALESRAAGVFALLAMAGELATEFNLTAGGEGEAFNAALVGYDLWRDSRGSGNTEDRQILGAIQSFIERHGDSRFSRLHDPDGQISIRDRAGYWKDDNQGRVFLFNSHALREAASGFDTARILNALENAGWLAERRQDKRAVQRKINGRKVELYAVAPGEAE